MRKTILFCFVLLAGVASAQYYQPNGARDLLRQNPLLSANNYTAYDNLYAAMDHSMTPAPEGYEPFYVSTYMRHGSRWLINPSDYTDPILFLEHADVQKRLTPEGQRLLGQLRQLLSLSPSDKLGVLTDVGFDQHNGIANRMCDRFPEVFNKKAYIHARSSNVPRCVKSMVEEVEVIQRRARTIVIQEAGKPEWQDYLAHGSLQPEIKAALKPVKSIIAEKDVQYIHPERLMRTLLKRVDDETIDEQRTFMRKLFELATNMQSHRFAIDLMPYFTPDEQYDLWQLKNINWYLKDGPAPQTGAIAPWRQMWLLQDFVDAADTLVNKPKFHGATLRFGHESCLMPLVSLMGLGTLTDEVQNLDTLDRVWRGSEIFPMAANVQLIFYRPIKGSEGFRKVQKGSEGEILVKALLNEREIALPVPAVSGPYCRWTEVRDCWEAKLLKHHFTSEDKPKKKKKHAEMRGAWIATVANIDWPSKLAIGDPQRQQAEMIAMLDSLQALHFNMIVFQVRPTADALYHSALEPVSKWLAGQQSFPSNLSEPLRTSQTPSYDPLTFTCTEAHKRGIEVHVWLNPYRVTGGGMTKDDLAPEHVFYKHPDWFVRYGKQYYFNPGLDEVRGWLNTIVADIVSRYDIDAVHFDDYFYPYRIAGEEFPDAQTFAAHPRGFDNIDDWRRNNTNMVIEELHHTIKTIKPRVEFGISPFGVWRNASTDPVRGSQTKAGVQNYDDLYADILLWLEKGWIDYVAPQLYWEIGKPVADYQILLDWWSRNTYGRKLYIGMAPYRIETNPDKAAKLKGSAKAWGEPNEICRQIRLNRTNPNCAGSIMYPIHSLLENPLGLTDSLRTTLYTDYVPAP